MMEDTIRFAGPAIEAKNTRTSQTFLPLLAAVYLPSKIETLG